MILHRELNEDIIAILKIHPFPLLYNFWTIATVPVVIENLSNQGHVDQTEGRLQYLRFKDYHGLAHVLFSTWLFHYRWLQFGTQWYRSCGYEGRKEGSTRH
jgi:hypothetical protein